MEQSPYCRPKPLRSATKMHKDNMGRWNTLRKSQTWRTGAGVGHAWMMLINLCSFLWKFTFRVPPLECRRWNLDITRPSILDSDTKRILFVTKGYISWDSEMEIMTSVKRVKTRPSVLGIRANLDCSVLSLLVLRQVLGSHWTNSYK